MLGELICFTAGFAAAALLVLAGYGGGTPPYLVAVTIGLVGVGVAGFSYRLSYRRASAARPAGVRIWSPALLRAVTAALELPAVPIMAVLYGLAAIGLLGNLVVPVLTRR